MLVELQAFCRIEREAREAMMFFEERHAHRQHAPPILQEIKARLHHNNMHALPKSAMGKAIGYMLRQCSTLEAYTRDSRVEIDNNLVENVIRPVVLGRKNYRYAGAHESDKCHALIYSSVATAKLHNVEPYAYSKDVLTKFTDHPHHKFAGLLSQNWRQSRSAIECLVPLS